MTNSSYLQINISTHIADKRRHSHISIKDHTKILNLVAYFNTSITQYLYHIYKVKNEKINFWCNRFLGHRGHTKEVDGLKVLDLNKKSYVWLQGHAHGTWVLV